MEHTFMRHPSQLIQDEAQWLFRSQRAICCSLIKWGSRRKVRCKLLTLDRFLFCLIPGYRRANPESRRLRAAPGQLSPLDYAIITLARLVYTP
jgi:hypothetical protein